MANEFYISAGFTPTDTSETPTANTFYISAGLVPDDLVGGTPTFNPSWAINSNIILQPGVSA